MRNKQHNYSCIGATDTTGKKIDRGVTSKCAVASDSNGVVPWLHLLLLVLLLPLFFYLQIMFCYQSSHMQSLLLRITIFYITIPTAAQHPQTQLTWYPLLNSAHARLISRRWMLWTHYFESFYLQVIYFLPIISQTHSTQFFLLLAISFSTITTASQYPQTPKHTIHRSWCYRQYATGAQEIFISRRWQLEIMSSWVWSIDQVSYGCFCCWCVLC